MCLSERTLQRRLQEEATSFNELVDDTRRELADQYLRDSQLTLAQVAYLLGFADQSTFFRACKRWFGTSPGEYRSRVAKGR
jgi:AraC-like DNA-binding protein